jgi:hypothetical protein
LPSFGFFLRKSKPSSPGTWLTAWGFPDCLSALREVAAAGGGTFTGFGQSLFSTNNT